MDTKDINEVELLEAFDVSLDTGDELRSLGDIQISGSDNGLNEWPSFTKKENRIKGEGLGWARVLDLFMGIFMGIGKEKYIWSCTDLSSSLCSNNCKKRFY